jgi:hypothetical protein
LVAGECAWARLRLVDVVSVLDRGFGLSELGIQSGQSERFNQNGLKWENADE